MNNLRNNRGVSLLDLLAAIVLFSILSLLIMNVIILVQQGRESIIDSEDITIQGMLITRQIENSIQDFEPTEVNTCVEQDNCIILTQSFYYEYNSVTGTLDFIEVNPVRNFTIYFNTDSIQLNDKTIDLSPYTITSTNIITITESTNAISIMFSFSLSDNYGNSAPFIASYSIPINN